MKRHDALVQLSHEHHHGLIWARKFYDFPDDASGDDIKDFLNEFFGTWHEEINPHFRKEEEILLPIFAKSGDPDEECIRDMLQQHILIRRDVLILENAPSSEVIHRLGNLLKKHIRLEEREVFPLVEDKLSEHDLDLINQNM